MLSSPLATRTLLLSYGFSHNIYVGLFHDKKCCNCINLFHCILWDFIVLSLVLNRWRLLKKFILRLGSWVVQLVKVSWESHARSWRVKCQPVFHESLRNLGQVASDPWNSLLRRFLVWLLYPSPILYIPLLPKKVKWGYLEKNHREVSTIHPPFKERAIHLLVRNHCSLLFFPLLLLFLDRRFVSKYNSHLFRV